MAEAGAWKDHGAGGGTTHASWDRLALGGVHPVDAGSAQGDGHQQRRRDPRRQRTVLYL
ncbi:hypothetical protein [Vulcanococcus limneticus]|uniref:hypothetical protein n=1 Tax=Vulcanococcus limneticus TaxID=2170428 RepID=UPI00398C0857